MPSTRNDFVMNRVSVVLSTISRLCPGSVVASVLTFASVVSVEYASGQEVSGGPRAVEIVWPQCWRFELVADVPDAGDGIAGQASSGDESHLTAEQRFMTQLMIDQIIPSLTPFKLFEEGHAVSLTRRIFWEDTVEGREVGSRGLFQGEFITFATPDSTQSRGIARMWTDISPSVRVPVSGTRFPCQELDWPPDGPPPQPGERTGVVPYLP